jgi:hypothetical protein
LGLVLGLRLGPRHSPDHILGWRIIDRDLDETVCHLRSGFLNAHNMFHKVDGTFVWSTFVAQELANGSGHLAPVSLFHRLLIPILLRRAVHA